MRPDVIVTWPRHCDFPLWRSWLFRNRAHVGDVAVAFTEHHLDRDYSSYVRFMLMGADVTFVNAPREDGRDWRDTAVNLCLDTVEGEWVWFMEQDLLVHDDHWFRRTLSGLQSSGAIGYRDRGSTRWHPSCMVVRRDIVERTGRYFGPDPVDHFHAFGLEVEAIAPFADLSEHLSQAVEFGTFGDFVHIGGLSRNHQLVSEGEYGRVRRPDEHARYLAACLNVECHPRWRAEAETFIRSRAGPKYDQVLEVLRRIPLK